MFNLKFMILRNCKNSCTSKLLSIKTPFQFEIQNSSLAPEHSGNCSTELKWSSYGEWPGNHLLNAMPASSLMLARGTGCTFLQTPGCMTDLPWPRVPGTKPISDLATSVLSEPGVSWLLSLQNTIEQSMLAQTPTVLNLTLGH